MAKFKSNVRIDWKVHDISASQGSYRPLQLQQRLFNTKEFLQLQIVGYKDINVPEQAQLNLQETATIQ
jgi:hypothetical protein